MNTAQQIDHSNALSGSLLARFVLERDESAFAELVRRYDRVVWGVCVRVLGNQCDAEDAFQQTFILLSQKADRIRKPGSLPSWLHGVAFRTATRIRNQRRHSVTENLIGLSRGAEPYEEIARRHQIEQIDQQLHLLHEKYRTPLVLFYFQDRSASQIAAELDLTVSAVEGRLRRGRQQLKRGLLGQRCDFSLLLPLMAVAPASSLLAATTSNSLAVGTGLIPCGLQNLYRIGVNVMIKKSVLAAVVVTLAGFAAALHAHPPARSTDDVDTTVELAEEAVPVFASSQTDEESDVSMHTRIRDLHDEVYAFLLSLHGA